MNEAQVAFAHVSRLALLALLTGMLWRGRVRHCWSFAAYLAAVLVGNTLVSAWPSRFYTHTFWVAKQGVYDVLKAAIALELAWRAFHAFPGAMRTARAVLLTLLAVSTFSLAALGPRSYSKVWEWQPAVATAALWLLTATALMVVWYQVPVSDWQRAIMLGLSVYLLVFVSLLDLLGRRGWELGPLVSAAETAAYLALLVFWNRVAWRRDAAEVAAVPAASLA
jgi:hypothetical protein